MRKNFLWVHAAILTICGTMLLTSCSDDAVHPSKALVKNQLTEDVWYVEYDEAGTFNYEGKQVTYTSVKERYDFNADHSVGLSFSSQKILYNSFKSDMEQHYLKFAHAPKKFSELFHQSYSINGPESTFWTGLRAYADSTCGGIITHMVTECPELSESDVNFLSLYCCDLPTTIIMACMGYNEVHSVYNKKRRIAEALQLDGSLDDYIREWKRLGLRFDAIQSGFLGSREQVDFVKRFIAAFRDERTVVCVDPVMGDYGRLYATYDDALAESMRSFLDVADVLTPNLTEACILADEPYRTDFSDAELESICRRLAERGAGRVVVSGIPRGETLVNFVYVSGRAPVLCAERKIGGDRSGTGDVFASVILADAVNGVDFAESVRRASAFTASAVRRSVELGLPEKDGLAIEEVIGELVK